MKGIKFSINHIKCIFYIPENQTKINEIVIICNGVTTKTYQKAINEIISKLVEKNYLVVFFDYINTYRYNRMYKDNLCLYKFEQKFELICSFLKERYPKYKLNVFSCGFGAYVTLNSIKDYSLEINKKVFNTPAINMRGVLKKNLAKENLIDFHKINPKKLDESQMEQLKDFYNELIEKDLLKLNNTFDNVFVIHDNRDNAIYFDDNIAFIHKCKDSKLIANVNSYNELVNNVIEIFK